GCGPLPNVSHAEPLGDAKHQGSFSVGSRVTYRCLPGYVKRPLLSDTVQCLANSRWSNLQEFCGRSCPGPLRLRFARILPEDEIQNFYAVGTTGNLVVFRQIQNMAELLQTIICSVEKQILFVTVAIFCPPPPAIPDGKHSGNGMEGFPYNSVVMYTCDPGLQLVGNETLRCTTENSVDGIWSGPPPECRVSTTAVINQTVEEKIAENPYWL
ncbi:PREDICTED: complement receptor type 1-like, partial [Tauraco erythrolophus]|uniref:complement receptor type 1-like n=1 Tax=Tauraco erythrolophus TaxID=121530 RepID=UPI00052340BF